MKSSTGMPKISGTVCIIISDDVNYPQRDHQVSLGRKKQTLFPALIKQPHVHTNTQPTSHKHSDSNKQKDKQATGRVHCYPGANGK